MIDRLQSIYRGSKEVTKVYKGDELIWQKHEPIYPYLTCQYRIPSAGTVTLCSAGMAQLCTSMIVDGVECPASDTYEFTSSGTHVVEWVMSSSSIPVYAFSGTSITKAYLPSNLSFIGQGAWDGCTAMTVCDMTGTNIWAINSHAFRDCWSLKAIKLPNVGRVVADTFKNCYAVNKVIIPNSVTTISDSAFYYVGEHAGIGWTLTIPGSVTSIGASAFEGVGAEVLVLNEGLQTIGDYAFNHGNMASVIIPSTVTSIGQYAFANGAYIRVEFLGQVPPVCPANAFDDYDGIIYIPSGSLAAYQAAMPDLANRLVER